MVKVSIVVPSFNHARFLSQRLNSITRQTYQDFEIILLDDASTDGSGEICERFAEQHSCRFIRNEVNSGGAFAQWNTGIRAATGEYVWIAESDDFADQRLLETLVDQLDRNPDCGLAYCQSLRVDEAGKILGPALPTMMDIDLTRWEHDYVNDGRKECAQFLIRENTVLNASAVVFRRELYDRVGGVDEGFRLMADWKFWASLLGISNLAYVAEPLNFFRTHAQTLRSTSRPWTELIDSFRMMAFLLDNTEMPRQCLEDFHTRVAILIMHTLVSERPTLPILKRSLVLASGLRIRFSMRASVGVIRQTLRAIWRRLECSPNARS